MKDQLETIMQHYQQSPARFADKIGVQRSSISHIISGRNKPSYDFIQKIAASFPEIDLNWLVSGEGNMLKHKANEPPKSAKSAVDANSAANLFSHIEHKIPKEPDVVRNDNPIEYTNVNHKTENHQPASGYISKQEITEVIVLYTDGSFKNYTPKT